MHVSEWWSCRDDYIAQNVMVLVDSCIITDNAWSRIWFHSITGHVGAKSYSRTYFKLRLSNVTKLPNLMIVSEFFSKEPHHRHNIRSLWSSYMAKCKIYLNFNHHFLSLSRKLLVPMNCSMNYSMLKYTWWRWSLYWLLSYNILSVYMEISFFVHVHLITPVDYVVCVRKDTV